MRILVHDYPGHPFQVQLSREFARRGHQVLHLYAGYNKTPRGNLAKKAADPETFSICPIYINEPLQKYNFIKRWQQEREYGELLGREIETIQPDVILSANTPLDAQLRAQEAARKVGPRFIFWLQDVIGVATHRLLHKKIPFVGNIIGQYYIRLERKLLKNSDHIVLITRDFQPLMDKWGISNEKTTVIPNWAPLNQISLQPKQNHWSQLHELADKFCFMYTGTLGMKHNPDLLVQLAVCFQGNLNVCVVVVSEGVGAEWLQDKKREYGLTNLKILDFQPFEQFPFVMASADVLVAILEPDAGVFSVPSKVLTYLCAQRPLLLAIPSENLAARITRQNEAGLVVDPMDTSAFVDAAKRLLHEQSLRIRFAKNGRIYAKKNFDIQAITDKFEQALLN